MAALIVTACVATIFLDLPAGAGRRATPVLTRAPKVVDYKHEFRIFGKVRNGRPGRTVYLKRRHAGLGGKIIREKRIPKDLTVRFTLHNPTKTATYRLVLHPGEPNRRVSNAMRVQVKPLFTFDVQPNHVKTRREVTMSGRLQPTIDGRRARLQIRIAGEWRLLRKVHAGDGKYHRSIEPDVRGRRVVRAVFRGDDLNAKAKRYERLWIYRRGEATWYGPGFYGNQTACGQTLRRKTLGVAHRRLPCGTKVDFLYKGHTITVPVIDRGPYGEADWDLTNATRRRLHFEGRDIVGYIVH